MGDDSETVSPPKKRFLDPRSPDSGGGEDILSTQGKGAGGTSHPAGELRQTPRMVVRRLTNAGLVVESEEVAGVTCRTISGSASNAEHSTPPDPKACFKKKGETQSFPIDVSEDTYCARSLYSSGIGVPAQTNILHLPRPRRWWSLWLP